MTKETRNNLLFIIMLLILVLPGGVILFLKKMQPGERAIGSPDPVRKATAYMDPFDLPDEYRRLVPEQLEIWRATLTPKFTSRTATTQPGERGRPLMSEKRMFEVIDFARVRGGVQWVVILWNPPGGSIPQSLVARCGNRKSGVHEATSIRIEQVDLPPNVLKEIRLAGYIKPPTRVGLAILEFPDVPNPTFRVPVELMLQFAAGNPDAVDFVRIFTNPVEVTK